jgi:acyl transferase domain-containing protein
MDAEDRALAIVGLSAILPDAPDVAAFWNNVKGGRYSVSDVPPERWDPALYFDPDPGAPEKTYSRIGGWVREFAWDPMGWRLPIPPRVAESMDVAQQWAVACARAALLDYGHPGRPLDLERTAVVIGTAMAGDRHYLTSLRVFFPEFARALAEAPSFAGLAPAVREAVEREAHARMAERLPGISEDSMPGELANCMAGRIANLFDLHGPNFVCDAACASALAAIDAAHDGLLEGEYDAALVGGVDRNMGPAPFVKFCKIGALSATGTRPYADGADGFVMGEGAAFFVLKRLADAERGGDRIYAVLRGVGGSSDGRGKGITAPNPVGQRLAIERAWRDAGLSPATVGLIEGHGTSTRVGDVVEFETLTQVFAGAGLASGSVALGSVKSNIGHLKGAAGAAGLLKAVLALHEKVLPPSLNCERPNPNLDVAHSPLRVQTRLEPWEAPADGVRRAGVSAFGFGGTNFHAVLEEHVPGRLTRRPTASRAVREEHAAPVAEAALATPPRGALLLGAAGNGALAARLEQLVAEARAGRAPAPAPPEEAALRAPERIAIDYGDAAELAAKGQRALEALLAPQAAQAPRWKALRAQGVFRGRGPAPKVAFLYTGQGSQYANMLRALRASEPVVAEVFAEADRVMAPLLGETLSAIVFPDPGDAAAVARAEAQLRRTEITQPAVLTVDVALTRLLARHGVVPDLVIGHSLGEYGALVASGALPFADALEAVSARGREMANVSVGDAGRMAAVMAPLAEIERVLAGVGGAVVVANVNSPSQAVIGGASDAVERALAAFQRAGHTAVPLPVSHAFHTSIVAPASEPLRRTLARLRLAPPAIPLVSNVTGELYPMGPGAVPKMLDLLAAQVASPVQFVKGLRTLHAEGARVFVEVGPKKALHGFASDVFAQEDDVLPLFTNHPKLGDAVAFNQALCGLFASGVGVGRVAEPRAAVAQTVVEPAATPESAYTELGRLFADFMERGARLLGRVGPERPAEPAVVTGAALGLPGRGRVFDDRNVQRILDGEQEIDLIPTRFRHAMVEKHITRLVKSGDGDPHFEAIGGPGEVIKLAARAGELDLEREFGVAAERVAALDTTSRLAIAAGIEALRDAGIPLVLRYRATSKGTHLPDRWMLPEGLRDDTGVIFASAFPGFDAFADELGRYFEDHGRAARIETLRALRERAQDGGRESLLLREIERRLHELEQEQAERAFRFDRRFLFRILPMAHAQFAELIGARGPNTHLNSACASTTQAFALAEDWIAAGRCRRVVVVAGDDVTTDRLLEWIGSGFLATGAAATDDVVEEAALPFDRRRHGMILGMGAAGVVIESPDCARERGLRPICELLSTVTANSAFHGTRLDVEHIVGAMERLVAQAERRFGLDRRALARELVFVSHETYTPARGGSASAEVQALRRVFGDEASAIVVANTKGLTGHAMGVGIEDVVAIKALETGVVPPVPNWKELDPELGALNLSRGGAYPVRYALRLGAGFGSQISLSLLRHVPAPDGARPAVDALGFETRVADRGVWQRWLAAASGQAAPELEVVQRTLRVREAGAPARVQPAPAAAPLPAAPAARPAEPAPAAAPPPAAGSDEAEVRARVLAIVAEKTGYPTDMLDVDLDLEADLGIDTVKQAETFAALREAWGIPRDENLKLRDYPTLAHAIRFVLERRPGGTASAGAATAAVEAPAPARAGDAPGASHPGLRLPAGSLDAANALPRRVPVAVLRPPLEHCVETGVALAAGARVVLMPDRGGVARALAKRLADRSVEVLSLEGAADRGAVEERIRGWLAAGPLHGVYWLPALDGEGELDELSPAQWRAEVELRVKLLYTAARALYEAFDAPGRFLVAATRLGGRHGYEPAGARWPLGGAVVGFAKALRRERPQALVKAVDFPETRRTAELADALVAETLRDPGAVEIGVRDGLRTAVALREEPAADGAPGLALGRESVIAVTGAAGSIVSAITGDLAAACAGGTFHLLDLVPEPDPDDPDLALLASDREGLKRRVFERLRAAGERGTPAQVERALGRIERSFAAAAALEAVRAAGGTPRWHGVDLLDADAVAKIVEAIRAESGRIDVLVHAAGLERSRSLPDKPPEEFDRIFDVKCDGWFHLLRAIGEMPLGATVAFSSIAGRFGNAGQTDYSAANDFLCKASARLHADRPGTRALAIDWTAWAEIGMASRGSIPELMARAGIDMLPPAAGIATVRRELTAGARSGEVLVAGSLGALAQEWHAAGGLDPDALPDAARGPMLGRVEGMGVQDGLRVATRLDPREQPFLFDHRIDGTPVLPGVMGVEAFAELARLALPGWHVAALEDVEFRAPFKLYRDEPRELELCAQVELAGDAAVARCRLLGRRTLPGQPAPQVTEHFRARVRLAPEPPAAERAAPPPEPAADAVGADAIYRVYFHGPAYRVLGRAWREGDGAAGRLADGLPAGHAPADALLATAPRLLELVFQTAGALEIARTGSMGLPTRIARVVFLGTGEPAGATARVAPRADGRGFDAVVLDAEGGVRLRVSGYATAALPQALDADLLAPLRAALG